MRIGEDERREALKVVVNQEQQYSIWPAGKDNPPGWYDEGTVGDQQVCLQHIKQVWRDMRPFSLRAKKEE